MRSFILGFVTGITYLQTTALLPTSGLTAACAAAALLLLACALMLRHPAARVITIASAGLLTGYAWAAFLAQATLSPELAKSEEGRDVHIVGIVETLPYRFDQGVRFDVRVERTVDAGASVPPYVALSWYEGRYGTRQAVGD
ncbi:conserved hypothetical protein, partial [Ricinus communis]